MRQKIPYIICFLLMVAFLFAGMNLLKVKETATINQETSLVDLRGFDFERDIVLVTSYTGNREFYPEQFYGPDDFAAGRAISPRAYSPADTNTIQYGTLRLTLLLPIGFTYGISGNTIEYSETTYVDGRVVSQIGSPGETRDATTPQVIKRTFYYTPQSESLEIIRQYANFNHREGGGSCLFYIGKAENIDRMNSLGAVSIWLVVGCMLTILIFYVGMFLLLGRKPYYLWFALCCLLIGVRTLNAVHFFELVWPGMSWYFQMTAQYMISIAITAVLVAYLRSLIPKLINKWAVRAFYLWMAFFAAVVLFTQPIVFTQYVKINQVGAGVFLLYVFVCLALNLRNKKPDEVLVFVGAAVFAIGWAGDILYLRLSATVQIPVLRDISQPAMMACVFINMVALALEFFRTESELLLTKMREKELSETNAMMDRVNKLKSDVISTISHESRTPLAVLASYAGLVSMELKSKGVDEQIAADLDTIAFEAERIANLIEGMKQLSQQNEITAKRTLLDVGDIIQQTVRLYRHIILRGNVQVETHISGDAFPVYGNPEELAQVLFNLLQNAKNYTENGTITIRAEITNNNYSYSTFNSQFVTVTVTDTGSGIAPELLPHVFERGVTDGSGGTGLGLALCKEIIENHGGEIRVESGEMRVESGTRVVFTLPVYDEVKNEKGSMSIA